MTKMQLINIKERHSTLFEQCWSLYQSAFPLEERRPLDYQEESMLHKEYRFDAIYDEQAFVGIVGWWQFGDLLFIEHLAILDSKRNGGYGKRMLQHFKQMDPKCIILEVEPPKDEMSSRRIGFYEREGFFLNHYKYAQPPFVGDKEVELLIMSYPKSISLDEFSLFKSQYLPKIHFRYRF